LQTETAPLSITIHFSNSPEIVLWLNSQEKLAEVLGFLHAGENFTSVTDTGMIGINSKQVLWWQWKMGN
jgi:hypothetical protein